MGEEVGGAGGFEFFGVFFWMVGEAGVADDGAVAGGFGGLDADGRVFNRDGILWCDLKVLAGSEVDIGGRFGFDGRVFDQAGEHTVGEDLRHGDAGAMLAFKNL